MSASGEYSLSNAWAVAPWVSRTVAVVHLIGMSIAWLMAEVVHYRSTPEVLAVWSINSGDILCLFMAPWMSWKAGGGQHELSLFLTLLASITILNRLPAFERRYGSWRCLASTLACLMAINGIFIGVMEASCLSSGISFDPYFGCNQYLWGMWPFAIFIVTRQCMDHPRGRVDFWGAWQISNKCIPIRSPDANSMGLPQWCTTGLNMESCVHAGINSSMWRNVSILDAPLLPIMVP
ncbi:hypothetical protein FOZ63_032684 [Perkinsus olseni]|uniref:Uncharacterized protein n=2 Tax=Perkinsus olseni TaxID=32597 RepID=A0A7J6S2W2_PEROL|nr:hypothetical protein FOZ63_032684 [Perkinsus olseni]